MSSVEEDRDSIKEIGVPGAEHYGRVPQISHWLPTFSEYIELFILSKHDQGKDLLGKSFNWVGCACAKFIRYAWLHPVPGR